MRALSVVLIVIGLMWAARAVNAAIARDWHDVYTSVIVASLMLALGARELGWLR